VGGILVAGTLIIILILEMCRYFRRISNSLKSIDDIKEKVTAIEELLKNQSK
jgi:hypothetical protein